MARIKILGQNIKKYREAKECSQEFLAEKLDFSREYISLIEHGKRYISLKKLFLLADILGVKISDLMNFN